MKEPHFEVFVDGACQWRFRLRAPNGEIICASEAYTTEQSCREGIFAVKRYAAIAGIVDLTAT